MIIKLYIYEDNAGNYKLSKYKLAANNNLIYYTFIRVYDSPESNTQQYFVYQHSDTVRQIISEINIDLSNLNEWTFLFDFFAYPKQEINNKYTKINVQYDETKIRNKISFDVPFDCWKPKFSLYVLQDTKIDPNIRVIYNNIINDKPHISIVMSYFNRKSQAEYTLRTIAQSSFKNVEVVIVDDGSNPEHDLENIIKNFSYKIVLIKISGEYKKDKNYNNPAVPYNMGFGMINGNIVIIQNPECCHHKDILNYVNANLTSWDYFDFSCLALESDSATSDYRKTHKLGSRLDKRENWYNHPIFRPTHYHFVCAMYRERLNELAGFSDMLGFGFYYDDNEITGRIKGKLFVRTVHGIDNIPFSIHQWHHHFTETNPNFERLRIKNERLYEISKMYL